MLLDVPLMQRMLTIDNDTKGATMELSQVELGEPGLWALRRRVEKLNRRAKRHGMEPLSVAVVREFTVDTDERGSAIVPIPRFDVVVTGCAPCIDGWRLAARVEFNAIVGCIVHVAPGVKGDYSAYRDHDGSCYHCNTCRRRNDVFVLIDSDGNQKVVGRNCLADFLRCESAAQFTEWAEWADKIGDLNDSDLSDSAYDDGWSGAVATITVERFLTVTSLMIRKYGWVSKGEAADKEGCVSTASNVDYYLYGRDAHHASFVAEVPPEPKDSELAAKAIEWLKTVDTSKSEYLYTIQRIGAVQITDPKLNGYTASIISAYNRACDNEVKRAAKNKEKGHFGSIGCRVKGVKVRVVRIRYFEGNYGVKTIVAMETALPDGKVAPIVWFASGEKDFEEGTDYTMAATIKGHDDNQYGKQTTVTRAKLT